MQPLSAAAAARRPILLPACAVLLYAVYGLTLFWPPPAMPLASPEPDAGLIARLFPNVPSWWISLRLACLGLASAAAVAATRARSIAWRDGEGSPVPADRVVNAALMISIGVAAVALVIPHFGRTGQTAFVLVAFVPAALLLAAQPRRVPVLSVPLLAFTLFWLAMRVPSSWRSPRCADPIDMWTNFVWFIEAVRDGRNILTHSSQPGLSDAWMLMQGISLLPEGAATSFGWFQAIHFGWLALTLVLVWDATFTMLGRTAAFVAAAALSFSPFFLSLPYNAAPFGMMTFLAAAMLALLARVHRRRSYAAAVALGPLLGFAATMPHLVPLAGYVAVAGLASSARRPRLPWRVIAASVLLAVAIVWPALPNTATVRAMMSSYVARNSEWQGLEAVLLGQRSVYDVRPLYSAGKGGALDAPLGAVLAPFAIPRTPLRLWGDSLLDPVAASLFALGLAACFRGFRNDGRVLCLLGLIAITISPGLVSGYERTSLHRIVAAPVVWSIVAAVGFTLVQRSVRTRLLLPGTIAAMGAAGVLLFDAVNPSIVPASWLRIALEANRGLVAAGKPTLLDHGQPERQPWLHVETIATHLPSQPIDSIGFTGPGDLEALASSSPLVLYWSPALGVDLHATAAVCARWPHAGVYQLTDAAGISRAFAAVIGAPGVTPALPKQRWSVHNCNDATDRLP